MGKPTQLPKIDFSCVDPSSPGAGAWAAVRAQVMEALSSAGCFEAHYPSMGPELRARLFGDAVKPLFSLPLETKQQNLYGPDKPFHGYVGQLPGLDGFESLAIMNGTRPEPVRAFAELMWPEGKPGFCETVHNAAKHMEQLEEMVRRMILESLGVLKYHEAQIESMWHLFRFSEYAAPNAEEKQLGYISHQDTNTLSIVCQHQVDGLEVQTKDGEWILVTPSPTSLIVMAGNCLRAWTNDRMHAPFHRIVVGGDVTRYSAMLFSILDGMIEAPKELVDEDHPSRFKSYDYDEFVRFCVSEEGARHEDKLKAYCGL